MKKSIAHQINFLMDPNDPNFPTLRSGRSITGEEPAPIDWNDVQTLLAIMMAFNEQAMKDGVKYANAAGRNIMTAEDFILGLKYNAVPSTGFYTIADLESKIASWRDNEVVQDMTTMAMGGEVEFSDDDEEEIEGVEEEDVPFSRAPDTDEVARKMHAAEQEYEGWEHSTTQREAVAIKRAIDKCIVQLESIN